MSNKSFQDIQELLKKRGAGEQSGSNIRLWNFQTLFPNKKEIRNLKKIGQGSDGAIYLKDIDGIKYALKVMSQKRNQQYQDYLNDVFQELSSLSAFRQDQILQLIGVAIDKEEGDDYTFCIFTEYQQKGSLKDLMMKKELFRGETDPNQILLKKFKLIQQIVEGVLAIHNSQTVHRYLRSQRIFLDENDSPKIDGIKSAEFIQKEVLNVQGSIK